MVLMSPIVNCDTKLGFKILIFNELIESSKVAPSRESSSPELDYMGSKLGCVFGAHNFRKVLDHWQVVFSILRHRGFKLLVVLSFFFLIKRFEQSHGLGLFNCLEKDAQLHNWELTSQHSFELTIAFSISLSESILNVGQQRMILNHL